MEFSNKNLSKTKVNKKFLLKLQSQLKQRTSSDEIQEINTLPLLRTTHSFNKKTQHPVLHHIKVIPALAGCN